MNPNDLAWKGTTIAEKQELLEYSRQERDRLVSEGKAKDGYLGLASTCVDIIRTAEAAIKDADEKIDAGAHREWQKLLAEVMIISKEAVDLLLKEDRKDWTPSDYEVAGAILLQASEGDLDKIAEGRNLLEDGIAAANKLGNMSARVLLCGQIVRASMATKNAKQLKTDLFDLHKVIVDAGDLDPLVSTRVYRALAEGAKFLAISCAEEAGSENQMLKAKNI